MRVAAFSTSVALDTMETWPSATVAEALVAGDAAYSSTRLFQLSATQILPVVVSIAMAKGVSSVFAAAKEPPWFLLTPVRSACPSATVATLAAEKGGVNFSMRLLLESETHRLPEASSTAPAGQLKVVPEPPPSVTLPSVCAVKEGLLAEVYSSTRLLSWSVSQTSPLGSLYMLEGMMPLLWSVIFASPSTISALRAVPDARVLNPAMVAGLNPRTR